MSKETSERHPPSPKKYDKRTPVKDSSSLSSSSSSFSSSTVLKHFHCECEKCRKKKTRKKKKETEKKRKEEVVVTSSSSSSSSENRKRCSNGSKCECEECAIFTRKSFVMPLPGADVAVKLVWCGSAILVPGLTVFVEGAGYFYVRSIRISDGHRRKAILQSTPVPVPTHYSTYSFARACRLEYT